VITNAKTKVKFLSLFGRINSTHPHNWDFSDQPLLLGKFFGGEGFRGVGLELSILMPLPWYVMLAGSANQANGEGTARSFYGAENPGVKGPQDFAYTTTLKQFFPLSDNWSLIWGLSAAFGPNPTGQNNRSEIYGTDLYLKYRPITRASSTVVALQAEWMLRRRQIPDGALLDHGLYAYLFWRFAKRWAAAARYEYVSGVQNDYLDPEWVKARQRISANVTFWPTEFSRLRLQYLYSHIAPGEDSHGVVLALEFAVGAHGAHRF
jgi:hypothetical protein